MVIDVELFEIKLRKIISVNENERFIIVFFLIEKTNFYSTNYINKILDVYSLFSLLSSFKIRSHNNKM